MQGTYFHVSDLLEQLAPQQDKEQGKDIADYLIKQDWRLFRKQVKKETPQPKPEPIISLACEETNATNIDVEVLNSKHTEEPNYIEPLEDWSCEIKELEDYFNNVDCNNKSMKLNSSHTITNCAQFIAAHLSTIKANNGNKCYLPYLNRLRLLKQRI